jgi:hypothetical protein
MSCPAGSYCKTWETPSVCQGTNIPCGFIPPPPPLKYTCATGVCVQDEKGLFSNCSDACAPPAPVYSTLTCCPQNGPCTYIHNASSCPNGATPKFCCLPNGAVTSAMLSQDSQGSQTVVCPTLGSIPTNDTTSCSNFPNQTCCYNGVCYQSKDPQCSYWGYSPAGTSGGMSVNSCRDCQFTPPTYCCDPSKNACSSVSGSNCPTGSYQTPDCGLCGYSSSTPATCCRNGEACGVSSGPFCPQGSSPVMDCSSCNVPTYATCCNNGECYEQSSCNSGDTQVSNCTQCPLPVTSPLNFHPGNGNWML